MAATAQPTDSGLSDRSVSKHPDLYTKWSAKTGSGDGGDKERTGHGSDAFVGLCATSLGFPAYDDTELLIVTNAGVSPDP